MRANKRHQTPLPDRQWQRWPSSSSSSSSSSFVLIIAVHGCVVVLEEHDALVGGAQGEAPVVGGVHGLGPNLDVVLGLHGVQEPKLDVHRVNAARGLVHVRLRHRPALERRVELDLVEGPAVEVDAPVHESCARRLVDGAGVVVPGEVRRRAVSSL